MRFFRGLFGLRPHRAERRDQRLSKIREMGFEVQDKSGTYKGKVATRCYILVAKDGKVLDNDGQGYASSSEAFRAAVAEVDARKR
jgi:hypothetical protein